MNKKHLLGIIILLIIFAVFASYIPEVFAEDNGHSDYNILVNK